MAISKYYRWHRVRLTLRGSGGPRAGVESMQHYAITHERGSTVSLVLVDGVDHDEAAMTMPAQEPLVQGWRSRSRG